MFDHKTVYPATQQWFKDLAAPYLRFIREEHDSLMTSHRTLTGGKCYLVGGSIYGPGGMRPQSLEGLKPLPPELQETHQTWLKNCDRHGNEWVRAQQTLSSAMSRTKNWQDVRDMFPDPLLRVFPAEGLMDLQRNRPDLYAGEPDSPDYEAERALREGYWEPKLLNMYEQAAPTINLYLSYRLL